MSDEKTAAHDEIARRLDRLERRARLATGTALVLLLGSAAVLALAAAPEGSGPPETLRARAFELVDGDGEVRAALLFREGAPALVVRDPEGRDRALLTHAEDGTLLYLLDDQGQPRLGAAHFAHGGSGLALHGPGGKGGNVLYLKDTPSLTFFDTEGQVTRAIRPE